MNASRVWSIAAAVAMLSVGAAHADVKKPAPKPAAKPAAAKPAAKPAPKPAAKPAPKPAAAKPAANALPAGVVATIDGAPVRQAEIDRMLWSAYGEQFVERAVNEEVIRQEAKKRGIKVAPGEVQQKFDLEKQQFVSGMGRTEADWDKLMNRYGKSNILNQMEVQALATKIGDAIAAKTTLTEEEKKDAVENLERQAHQVHAEHILVGIGPRFGNRTEEEAEKRVQEVLSKLAAGEKWEELAKEYSDDQSNKDKGGDLGFFGKGMMVKEFEDAVFAMKPGEVSSEPVKTAFGYHIIRLVEVKDDPVTAEDRQKAIASALEMKKQQAKSTESWFTEARSHYKIVTHLPWD